MSKRCFLSKPAGQAVLIALFMAAGYAAGAESFDESLIKFVNFRNMGPYRVGAAISDIAVPESPLKAHLYTFYIATWSGGLWKTVNNGTTFEPVFEGPVGDVALAPFDPDIVWVGTDDAFGSVRSHAGDGVYKSVDGGRTWANVGLRDSHHIARIIIHPSNPDVAYVAAMGHLFSFNRERGVQDDGRRPDLAQSPVRQRENRGCRPGHGSVRPQRPLRRRL